MRGRTRSPLLLYKDYVNEDLRDLFTVRPRHNSCHPNADSARDEATTERAPLKAKHCKQPFRGAWRGIVREGQPMPPWEWSGGRLHSINQNTICQFSLRTKQISYSSDPFTKPAVCECANPLKYDYAEDRPPAFLNQLLLEYRKHDFIRGRPKTFLTWQCSFSP